MLSRCKLEIFFSEENSKNIDRLKIFCVLKVVSWTKHTNTYDHTFIIGNIFCYWGSITGSCCHVQKWLNNFNFEHSIFLPKVQHTDYFTLLCERKQKYSKYSYN